jgi:alkanesulfonate monooxygenase SsuD/methylene tetrahydromethanopterin reductase-like flavin-dependent oxidoreductase (luciferase family)
MHFVTLGGTDRVKGLVEQYGELWEASRSERRRIGSPVEAPLVGVGRHVFVAETDAEADRLARPAYGHWYGSVAKLWRDHGGAPVTGMLIDGYDQARRLGVVAAGSPATVRRELLAQAEAIGFNYFVGQFAWGSLTHEQEMASLDLFVSEVMPALAQR